MIPGYGQPIWAIDAVNEPLTEARAPSGRWHAFVQAARAQGQWLRAGLVGGVLLLSCGPGCPVAAQELPQPFVRGPARIELGSEAMLALPAAHAFLPAVETRALLREWGNRPSEHTLGMVIPTGEDSPPPWFMVIGHVPDGHVAGGDLQGLDAERLLVEVRRVLAGTDEARRVADAAPTEVLGWLQAPRWDALAHRLSWALSVRDRPPGAVGGAKGGAAASARGGPPDEDPDEDPDLELIANDNTVLLGRAGYLTVGVVLPVLDHRRYQADIASVIAGLQFRPGRAWNDFDAATDPASARTLPSLIVAEPAARKDWLARLQASGRELGFVLGAMLVGVLIGGLARLRARLRARRTASIVA
jgi:uncharacterized membrane-anchored protein